MSESVADKAWERIQQKTFTKWVNSHLRKRKIAIADLKTDFSTGVELIQFLEIISSQTLPKYEKKPKIRIQKIGNVSTALDFLKAQKIRLVNISPEDIVDENLKLILGLIWTIIQKFQIDDISEEQMSAKEALLLWCQKKTAGYKDCKVDNFTWSFQDGLALCALINKHRPDLIDYSKLNKENKAENLQLAFDVAEKELGIPKLLDVEDMVDIKPDERSVITYVSQYYHVFSQYNQAEVAGRRIGKLVDLTEALDGMKNDYGNKAEKLATWIKETTPQMEERNFDDTLPGVQSQLEEFQSYKTEDKPPKAADKANVEALFNNINMKLRANDRPSFEPPAGLAPSDVDSLWEKLGTAESEREKALTDELRRQEKLAYLRKRYDLKAGKLESWIAAKEEYLQAEESVNSLNEADSKLKNHDVFDNEYANSRPRVDALQEVCKELQALNPSDGDAIQQKTDELSNRWSALESPQKAKRSDLEEKLAKEQKKEELRKEFAKKAKEYGVFNKETSADVNDHFFGDDLDAVQACKEKLDSSDAENTQSSSAKKENLDQLWNELQQLGVTENRYSPITEKDIESQHNNLLSDMEKRQAAYQAELERQIMMDEKRKEFAQKAKDFADSSNARKDGVSESFLTGEPEETSQAIKDSYQDGKPEKDGLAALESLQNELSSLGIRDNKYSQFTMADLKAIDAKFANQVRNQLRELSDESEMKKDYNGKAQALHDWANGTLPSLKERDSDNTLSGAKNNFTQFQTYLTTEKGRKDNDRINLDTLFNKIGDALKSNNRPEFSPNSPLDPASVSALWDQVNSEAKEKESAVGSELARQQKLNTMVKKFNSDADDLDSWALEKEDYLAEKEEVSDLDTARMKVKFLEVFNSEFANQSPALDELKKSRDEISALNYCDMDSVNARCSKLDETFARFTSSAEEKNKDLSAAMAEQQANEDLRIHFANQARDFSRFHRDAMETAGERNFGYSLEEVSDAKSALDSSDAELKERSASLKSECDATSASLADRGVSDNRHTTLNLSDIETLQAQLDEALEQRSSAHGEELARQQTNEDKRKHFAEKADAFVAEVDSHKQTLSSLSGEADEKISSVENLYQEGAPTQAKVEELVSLNEEMQALGIYDNKHTANSIPAVKTRKSQFDASVNNFLQDLKEEKEFNERSAALQAEYEQAVKRENMRITYDQDSSAFKQYLDSAYETLSDPIRCDLISDAEEYQTAFDDLMAGRPAQSDKYDSLVSQSAEMSSAGVSSGVPLEELTGKWNTFLSDCDLRKEALSQEMNKQKNNEDLRVQFADKASALHSFIQEHSSALNSLSGELEEQLSAVQSRKPTVLGGSSLLNEVEDLANKLDQAGVRSNRHTELSFPTLKVDYEELVKLISSKEGLIQKEIIQKANSNVSAEQLAEFKEVFEHFDKDKSGRLGRLEFKSCLQSLGEDLSDSEIDRIISEIGVEGKVPFEAFVQFASAKAADSDSQPQILEAFKTLAGDKEFITEDDMRRALPSEKVDYLVKNMPLYKGQAGSFDYVSWAKSAFC